jgi:methyl-accepting chemotaxis protein
VSPGTLRQKFEALQPFGSMSTPLQKQLTHGAAVLAPAVVAIGMKPELAQTLGLVGLASGAVAFFLAAQFDRAPWDLARTAVRRLVQGKRLPKVEAHAHPEVARLFEELEELETKLDAKAAPPPEPEPGLSHDVENAVLNVRRRTEECESDLLEISRALSMAQDNVGDLSQNLERLQTNADESSSSILQISATNDEVAENIGELASSVREMVSSIEEMTFSIREVATNVDALSLTAEETSSSMNEMDVSIDQVQSNANETARLSENVAQDAELGAEAILKTMGEIYRIKESSQEALGVINNLGSRIEAIGEILNVIDDVAEQTNLLALNAAIIAAQAGEHGKGFAVVADEIKDLADRAGASTKEIADLIKTVQLESRNAIAAVEQGADNVDRGVEVSNEAERALKKILESSKKSTNMVRAIARATVEQAKGSKQVTDSISRIAETVQQIAAATAQQARGSELIMKSGERMRTIAQQVERSSQEQKKGGRQIAGSVEAINAIMGDLNRSQRSSQELLQAFTGRLLHLTSRTREQKLALGEMLSGPRSRR